MSIRSWMDVEPKEATEEYEWLALLHPDHFPTKEQTHEERVIEAIGEFEENRYE